MARGRSSGAGYAVALVVMGCLFFISLIFAVIFFVQFNAAQTGEREAQETLARYVTSDLQQNVRIASLEDAARRNGNTVVATLLAENRYLKQNIFGDAGLELGDINQPDNVLNQRKQELGLQLALFQEITTLQATVNALNERQQTAQRQLTAEREKAEQLTQAQADIKAAYDQAVNQLQSQMNNTTQGFDASTAQAREALDKLETDFKEQQAQFQSASSDSQERQEQLESELAQLRIQIDRLTAQQRKRMQLANITPADGQIVSVEDATDTVYINRGSGDQILLGMTFEVFDPDQLIKLDDDQDQDDFRGKATIEVFQVNDTSARARIVRKTPRTFIKPGDAVANLVYDPNKTFKFYIYGDFDLDGDGETTSSERRRIEALVRDWGGDVVNELNYDVDFLVLGKRPELPAPLSPNTLDIELINAHKRATERYEKYTSLEGNAKRLSIPVLNQNRFYTLIGLYDQR